MSKSCELRCLGGVHNGALASGELPVRLSVLRWGDNPSQRGPVRVGPKTLAALGRQVEGGAFARVRIDYEHNSEPGHPNFEKPPRFMAGYGDVRAAEGEGVWLESVEWTPSGRQYAREYSDLSPAVSLDADGEVVFFSSLALCPNGAVHDLTFYGAENNAADGNGQPEGIDMEEVKKLQEQVAAMASQMEALAAGIEALSARVTELSGEKPEPAAVTELSARVAEQEQKILSFQGELDRREREALLRRAAAEGKVVALTAEQVGAMAPKDLAEYVGRLPATVPVERRTPEHVQTFGAGLPADEGQLEKIARQCGMDPAAVRAANGGNR